MIYPNKNLEGITEKIVSQAQTKISYHINLTKATTVIFTPSNYVPSKYIAKALFVNYGRNTVLNVKKYEIE